MANREIQATLSKLEDYTRRHDRMMTYHFINPEHYI